MISELISKADQALADGRHDEVGRLCGQILKMEPGNSEAKLLLGVAYVKTGQFQAALPLLEGAEEGSGKASLWLSRAFRQLGRPAEALPHALRAADILPGDSASEHQLGMCYLDARSFEEAASCFQKAIAADPNVPIVHLALGKALQALGRNSAAVVSFKRAAGLDPNSPVVLESLFQALMDESDALGAVECAKSLLRIRPREAQSHLRLARALLLDNKDAEAEAHLDEASRLGSNDGRFAFALGTVLQGLGRVAEAEAQFRRSIELFPNQGVAYSAFAYNRKMDESDLPLVSQMRALCDSVDSPAQGSHLHYALGKTLEDLGQFEDVMRHYDRANALVSQVSFEGRTFDRELYRQRLDRSRDAFRRLPSSPSTDELPIFVVGMIRSGTTLVEQILSSHPEVGGGGELGFWLQNRDAPFHEAETLRQLGGKYLSILKQMWPGKRRVVDKMPDNYLLAPVLHAAFPKAKIIHLRRDPADTCLSIYTTINRLPIEWAHDKENIAFVYREYMRLMEDWRQLIANDSMLEIHYEDIVSEPEKVARQMLDFCGLDWNEACLRPELNARSVATPSAWQVRQPLYRTSMGRWRRFEPWLGTFAALSKTVATELPG